eukprot:2656908-Pleurochrysis_carterae.AAC.1
MSVIFADVYQYYFERDVRRQAATAMIEDSLHSQPFYFMGSELARAGDLASRHRPGRPDPPHPIESMA